MPRFTASTWTIIWDVYAAGLDDADCGEEDADCDEDDSTDDDDDAHVCALYSR